MSGARERAIALAAVRLAIHDDPLVDSLGVLLDGLDGHETERVRWALGRELQRLAAELARASREDPSQVSAHFLAQLVAHLTLYLRFVDDPDTDAEILRAATANLDRRIGLINASPT